MAPADVLRALVRSSLVEAGAYEQREDGSLEVRGRRPAAGWQGHGYFDRWLWVLRDGALVRVKLWKHRWRRAGSTTTCHSRSPEELGSLGACAVIVVLSLWSWLDGGGGLHSPRRVPVLEDLEESGPSTRTMQRWLCRALPDALAIQQAIRLAVIERCEPRPVETLFVGGLSPPEGLMRRPWRDPPAVASLWRAFAILLGGAFELDVPASLLLAEARRRWSDHDRHPAI